MATSSLQTPPRWRASPVLRGWRFPALVALFLCNLSACITPVSLPPDCGALSTKTAQNGNKLLRRPQVSGNWYRFHQFFIHMPKSFRAKKIKKVILFQNASARAVRIKLLSAQDLSLAGQYDPFASSQYQLAQYPELMFFNRPRPRLQNAQDQFIWRLSQENKCDYFKNTEQLYYSQKKNLRWYFAKVHLLELSQLAFVADSTHPDQLLMVLCYNSSFTFCLDRIASIHTRSQVANTLSKHTSKK